MQNLTGKKYNRLTVVSYDDSRDRPYWFCLCECGNTKSIRASSITRGESKSCGCLQKEAAAKAQTTHGLAKTKEYAVWIAMRDRCNNPNNPAFKDYGGRGIRVCNDWYLFENFIADMGPRPSDAHSIDRIDNDGNYCSSNCRWATRTEQANNRKRLPKLSSYLVAWFAKKVLRRK